jgi:hypothetical protein
VTDSECDPFAVVVDDLDPLLRPRQVLAIGEWHGTEEFPAGHGSAGAGAARPRALTRVLAGNQHTRVDGGSGDGSGQPALGYHLRRWHPELVALLVRASGGQAWMITGVAGDGGGPKPIPDDADLPSGASWTDRPGPDGHHGFVHVGRLTASPPAG